MSITRQTFLCVAALTLIGVLGGCASKGTGSYVVLLRDPDGNLGQVVVKTPQGEQVLTQVFRGAALDGSKEPFFVMQDQLKRDFGAAMAALPPPPSAAIRLRFVKGTELDADSENLLRDLPRLVSARTAPDISVIGHGDSNGTDARNIEVGQNRADEVAKRLRALLPNVPITTGSHGKREPLVSFKPEGEPENRRVEVWIR